MESLHTHAYNIVVPLAVTKAQGAVLHIDPQIFGENCDMSRLRGLRLTAGPTNISHTEDVIDIGMCPVIGNNKARPDLLHMIGFDASTGIPSWSCESGQLIPIDLRGLHQKAALQMNGAVRITLGLFCEGLSATGDASITVEIVVAVGE